MIDVRILREEPERVRERMAARGADIDWEAILAADRERRETLARWERLKEQKNKLSGEIGRLKKSGGDASALMEQIGAVSAELDALGGPLSETERRFSDSMLDIPNLPDPGVPVGESEADNPVLRHWGAAPAFGFTPKNHWEIGEALGILDFARGAKITGARFTLYRGQGALLERALIGFMLDLQTREHGYEEILPPFLVNRDTMTGTGQLPKFEADMFHTVDPDYFLIPTAEVPLTNIHRDEVLDRGDLPRYYCAHTPCFRREAGSYGQDMRGLIRQHQFNKVELVKIVEPEQLLRGAGKTHPRCRSRAPAPGTALPGGGAVHRGPGLLRGQDLRHRGVAPGAGNLPGDQLLLQLHRLPGPPRRHPLPPGAQTAPPVRAHPQRLRPRRRPHRGCDHGELPAGRRQHRRPGGAAFLHGRVGKDRVDPSSWEWRPLTALRCACPEQGSDVGTGGFETRPYIASSVSEGSAQSIRIALGFRRGCCRGGFETRPSPLSRGIADRACRFVFNSPRAH